jgi:hypothetical protein
VQIRDAEVNAERRGQTAAVSVVIVASAHHPPVQAVTSIA